MNDKIYDLIIIGAGASGLMAAYTAASDGLKVLVIEKNEEIGKKILITGKGRCNITTSNTNISEFIQKFGKNGKFLYSALHQFSISNTIDFFNNVLNIKTKTERGNRIFPVSDSAKEITEAFQKSLRNLSANLKLETRVTKFKVKNKKISAVITNNGEFFAKNFLIATGGKSYPLTGSSGDGYYWLEQLGHKIIKPQPVLTPLICKEKFIKDLEGLSLKNVRVSCDKLNLFGEALFTNNGLSGPIILDLSSQINIPNKITIDFKPALNIEKLDKRILRDFNEAKTKKFKNSLAKLLPKKLIPVIIDLSKINPDKPCNLITKKERTELAKLLKNFKLTVIDIVGFKKAVVTRGGIELKEINPKTMQSKIIENLYVAGEILNIDGPTGGYNLQVAWSTGFVAGNMVGNMVGDKR